MRRDEVFRSFCVTEYAGIVGALTLYCGNGAVAEELAQEAFVRAYQHWSRVRRLDNPRAWVNRVALNLANSYFRRMAAEQRARRLIEAFHDRSYNDPDPSVLEVRRALAGLPRRQRRVLILRYYIGLSVGETAEELGCPEGTVKRLTHQAVTALRANALLRSLREVSDGT